MLDVDAIGPRDAATGGQLVTGRQILFSGNANRHGVVRQSDVQTERTTVISRSNLQPLKLNTAHTCVILSSAEYC